MDTIKHMLSKKRERFAVVERSIAGDIELQVYPEKSIQGIISTVDILSFIARFPYWLKKRTLQQF